MAPGEWHRLVAWGHREHDSLAAVSCLEQPTGPGSFKTRSEGTSPTPQCSREHAALTKILQRVTFTTTFLQGLGYLNIYFKTFCY